MPRKNKSDWVNPPARRKAHTAAQVEALTKTWYKKLARSGFEDIEDETGTPRGDTTKRRAVGRDPVDAQARLEYYTTATHFLVERVTPWSKDERAVWVLHADGLSYREAAARAGLAVHHARGIIERLRREMFALRVTALAEPPEEEV